ncbi:acyltransferase family protein [Polynucleobacter sp. AM-26B4]|uniref:acyltransferase family protein n=1 Tax=Polynucleobacter sp. AM-26B4 TaxID=2689103 RepID=UPI001C0B86AB|nr:acyltransferase family protein [Polynucleobacter sp. AM-26B4]MBU3585175.1 acyltransferase family protein [Polynucleobacter sp. AM-26B4]
MDSLRGIAALMTVLFHLVAFAELTAPSGFEFIGSYFGKGVPLFFCLSGFVLAYGYSKKLEKSGSNIIDFYLKRFFRIAPLFYIVLICWRGVGHFLWMWSESATVLFLNFTFLFGLVPTAHESLVMARWSIGIEMLFYLAFPIIIILMGNIKKSLIIFIISLIMSSIVYQVYSQLGMNSYAYMNAITQAPFFIAGILTFRLWEYRDFKKSKYAWLLLLLALTLVFVLITSSKFAGLLDSEKLLGSGRNIWAIIFCLIIYSCCNIKIPFLTSGPMVWIGQRSYSIYLLHPIILIAMVKNNLINLLNSHEVNGGFFYGAIIVLAATLLASSITFTYVEKIGISFGNKLIARDFKFKDSLNFLYNSFCFERSGIKYLSNISIGGVRIESYKLLTIFLSLFALLYSSWVAINYSAQPLVDIHAFRQSQTALTSYWLAVNGFSFAYETPVAGYPWSIPFEFPLYQYMVSILALIFNASIEQVGRLTSYLFLLSCIWPVSRILRIVNAPKLTIWVFSALFLSTPLYMYWGRTFLIETTALSFSIFSLYFGLEIILKQSNKRNIIYFLVFSILAILQKSTTEGPVLLYLIALIFFVNFYRYPIKLEFLKASFKLLPLILIPLLVGLIWAHYTDLVKSKNLFGSQLSSSSLFIWNFGSISQKFSLSTWDLIIWERVIKGNFGGYFGLLILALALLTHKISKKYSLILLSSFILFLLPLIIFTNLNYVHEYYQVASVIYLIFMGSVIITVSLPRYLHTKIVIPFLMIPIITFNYYNFSNYYGNTLSRPLEQQDVRSVQAYQIGKFINKNTPENSAIVLFGQDWSSEIAFNSKRKSFAAPEWFAEYAKLWESPEKYLGGVPLSAIVVCPSEKNFPDKNDIELKTQNQKFWKKESVSGCSVLLNQRLIQP